MDDKLKGQAAGIFFIGYMLMQMPGGYLAQRWSARKLVSLCLIGWGVCAVGCGLSRTYTQFAVMRFFLGVAESAVYPATLVLLYHWFPRSERARATGYWNLCQPLAVAVSSPVTSALLGGYGWHKMLILEGALPFLWLPIWWFCIRDHPSEAKWLSPAEREHIESTLREEASQMEPAMKTPLVQWLARPFVLVMLAFYFLHNCAVYGCITFFTDGLKNQGFTAREYGWLFALPYAVTAVVMVLVSRSSDRKRERRRHLAFIYGLSGVSLILSVVCRGHFWLSYAFLCLAIPGPFAGQAPFWANASETLPRNVLAVVIGLVNALGNVGGYAGPSLVGGLTKAYHSTAIPFILLGVGMLGCTALAFFLPKAAALASDAGRRTRALPAAGSPK
jgi:MFS family permease